MAKKKQVQEVVQAQKRVWQYPCWLYKRKKAILVKNDIEREDAEKLGFSYERK